MKNDFSQKSKVHLPQISRRIKDAERPLRTSSTQSSILLEMQCASRKHLKQNPQEPRDAF